MHLEVNWSYWSFMLQTDQSWLTSNSLDYSNLSWSVSIQGCCRKKAEQPSWSDCGGPVFTEISEISHRRFMNATFFFFIGMIQMLQICFILVLLFFFKPSNLLHVHPVKFEYGVNETSGVSEMASKCTPKWNVSMHALWHVCLTLFSSMNSRSWIPYSRAKRLNQLTNTPYSHSSFPSVFTLNEIMYRIITEPLSFIHIFLTFCKFMIINIKGAHSLSL